MRYRSRHRKLHTLKPVSRRVKRGPVFYLLKINLLFYLFEIYVNYKRHDKAYINVSKQFFSLHLIFSVSSKHGPNIGSHLMAARGAGGSLEFQINYKNIINSVTLTRIKKNPNQKKNLFMNWSSTDEDKEKFTQVYWKSHQP